MPSLTEFERLVVFGFEERRAIKIAKHVELSLFGVINGIWRLKSPVALYMDVSDFELSETISFSRVQVMLGVKLPFMSKYFRQVSKCIHLHLNIPIYYIFDDELLPVLSTVRQPDKFGYETAPLSTSCRVKSAC